MLGIWNLDVQGSCMRICLCVFKYMEVKGERRSKIIKGCTDEQAQEYVRYNENKWNAKYLSSRVVWCEVGGG